MTIGEVVARQRFVQLLGSKVDAGSLFGAANFIFCNESGLADVVRGLSLKPGAVVGVSGSVLEIGAITKADLIVSVDGDVDLADAVRA